MRYPWAGAERRLRPEVRTRELLVLSQHFADFAENVVRAHPQRGTALGEAVFEAHNRLNAALDRRDELAVLSGLEELAAALQPFFTPPPP